ncbi:MAG: hypothetical protein WC421_04300 [Elusimicrobiales bacterium]
MKMIAVIALAAFSGTAAPAQEKPVLYSFTHDYKTGEKISYDFEDVDYIYSLDMRGGFETVKDFLQAEEIRVRVNETVVEENGEKRKKFEITGAQYRKIANDKDKISSPGMTPLPELIAGYPQTLAYTCRLDEGDFTSAILKAYQTYMGNPIGLFLYYKLMDVHTFGPTVARLEPQSLGFMQIRPSRDIPLKDGVFHNRNPVMLFQRVDTINGAPQAYFKVMTMGNYYKTANSSMDTNYQYTFHVSLDGPRKGLLFGGELQEHIFAHDSKKIISRQLSIRRVE